MRYISHRGNLDGKNTEHENNPNYIQKALDIGFDVEIDLWINNDQLYLGHDYGQHPIHFSWINLRKDKLWIHCKNIEALMFCNDTDFNYFWHQEDDYTLTSKGFVWTYPNKQLKHKCIMVLPERFVIDIKTHTYDVCYGICSDYINIIKDTTSEQLNNMHHNSLHQNGN
jgi:hypothetical protein